MIGAKFEMKKKIVLADDDQDFQFILTLLLKNAGCEVMALDSGTAIVNNRCLVPDLFIIDVKMKIIDGFALCKYLKLNRVTKDVPVILMSGFHENRKRALAVGADYFVSKPFDIAEFLKIMDDIMSRPQLLAGKTN
jgi:CheY-like chemotaxis protein